VFVTALYTFRMFFMTFRSGSGKERMDHRTTRSLAGAFAREPLGGDGAADRCWRFPRRDRLVHVKPVLFGNYFGDAIHVLPANNVVEQVGEEFHGPVDFALSGFWRRRSGWRLGAFDRLAVLPEEAGAGPTRPAKRTSNGCARSWSISTTSTGSTSTSSCGCRGIWAYGLWRFGDQV
jgi:hypothetical protein